MKLVLIAAALSVAVPVTVTFVPTPADAQVLAGRYAARANQRPAPRPPLSEREENRLYAAQDEVASLTQQIADIQAAAATGLTAEQQTQLQAHQTRLAEQQAIVDRLEAKRNRRS